METLSIVVNVTMAVVYVAKEKILMHGRRKAKLIYRLMGLRLRKYI